MVGQRLDPIRARLEDLDRPRLGVGALGLADPRPDAVAGDAAGDEHHVAVQARDAGAAEGERVDGQLELGRRAAGGEVWAAVSIVLAWQPHGSGRLPALGRVVPGRADRRVLPALRRASGPSTRSSRSTPATPSCSPPVPWAPCGSGARRSRRGPRRAGGFGCWSTSRSRATSASKPRRPRPSWPGARRSWCSSCRRPDRSASGSRACSRPTSPIPRRGREIEEARLGGDRARAPAAVRGAHRAPARGCAELWAGRATSTCASSAKGVDYTALAEQTAAFSSATDQSYPAVLEPGGATDARAAAGRAAPQRPAPVLPGGRCRTAAFPSPICCRASLRRCVAWGSTSPGNPAWCST